MTAQTSLPSDFAREHAAPAPKRIHLNVLSNSAIACYRRCAREFKFRYVMLRRPCRAAEALRFGSFFHVGLNAWWQPATDPVVRLNRAVEAMRVRAESRPEDADPFELVKAEELMLGYTARWGDVALETIEVEKQFSVPLVNPASGAASRTYRIEGAIDVLARDGAKNIQIEHKTTSDDISWGTDYWRFVSAVDPQISTYQAALKELGLEATTLYDVVRKVALRPKQATPVESRRYTKKGFLDARQRETDETPDEFRERVRADIAEAPEKYFTRGPIVRLENDEREHAGDVWQTAAMIRMSENSGSFPRNPGSCRRFHRLCEYFEVCSGNASIDDDSRFRAAARAHEELKEV